MKLIVRKTQAQKLREKLSGGSTSRNGNSATRLWVEQQNEERDQDGYEHSFKSFSDEDHQFYEQHENENDNDNDKDEDLESVRYVANTNRPKSSPVKRTVSMRNKINQMPSNHNIVKAKVKSTKNMRVNSEPQNRTKILKKQLLSKLDDDLQEIYNQISIIQNRFE